MKKILLGFGALLSVSTLTFASTSSFIESQIDIHTEDTLVVQPDYNQASGSANASLLNFNCHKLKYGRYGRYGCLGTLRMTDSNPGYETIVVGSSKTPDHCTMTFTSDGKGNIAYDASTSSCVNGIDKWSLSPQNTINGISVAILESH